MVDCVETESHNIELSVFGKCEGEFHNADYE